jgi:hypothetical protein
MKYVPSKVPAYQQLPTETSTTKDFSCLNHTQKNEFKNKIVIFFFQKKRHIFFFQKKSHTVPVFFFPLLGKKNMIFSLTHRFWVNFYKNNLVPGEKKYGPFDHGVFF